MLFHLVSSAVLFWDFMCFKRKNFSVSEQSKSGLFVVVWMNNKPVLQQPTVASWGGGKDGEENWEGLC